MCNFACRSFSLTKKVFRFVSDAKNPIFFPVMFICKAYYEKYAIVLPFFNFKIKTKFYLPSTSSWKEILFIKGDAYKSFVLTISPGCDLTLFISSSKYAWSPTSVKYSPMKNGRALRLIYFIFDYFTFV